MSLLLAASHSVTAALARPGAALLLEDEGAPSGPLYQIGGLPVHPLVVHAAVVLLPLAALGLFVIFFSKRLRKSLGWVVLGCLAVGVGGAVLSKESGEQLAAAIGLPARHAELAEQMTVMSMVLLGVAVVWYGVARLADRKEPSGSMLATVLGIIMLVVAAITLIWTVLVGHSGAQAVWEGELPDTSATTSPSATPSGSPDTTVSPVPSTTAAGYTMEQVAAHGTQADCWSAVGGSVYNLTDWIAAHPGGSPVIVRMCGTDATAAFQDQHGTGGQANAELAKFLLGPLAGSAVPNGSPSASASTSASDVASEETED